MRRTEMAAAEATIHVTVTHPYAPDDCYGPYGVWCVPSVLRPEHVVLQSIYC